MMPHPDPCSSDDGVVEAPIRKVPRTKLWKDEYGTFIVLECVCGGSVSYPGHRDDTEACPACGRVYQAVDPEQVVAS